MTTAADWSLVRSYPMRTSLIGRQINGYRIARDAQRRLDRHAQLELECLRCGACRVFEESYVRESLLEPCPTRPKPCPCDPRELQWDPVATRDCFRITPAEALVVVAVIAVERVEKRHPTRKELCEALGKSVEPAAAIRRGYLEMFGKKKQLISTERAWRDFGVRP